jgi:hypothetical protein
MKLGSGIRKKTYSGSRIRIQGQKGTGSLIRIRNNARQDNFRIETYVISGILGEGGESWGR